MDLILGIGKGEYYNIESTGTEFIDVEWSYQTGNTRVETNPRFISTWDCYGKVANFTE